TTVMNTATNPRTTTPNTTACASDSSSAEGTGPDSGSGSDDNSDSTANSDSAAANLDAVINAPTPAPDLDRRTLAQQRLDGLVGGCKAALAAGTLPATGGLRPQVMVTINHHDLLNSIETAAAQGPRYAPNGNRPGTRQTNEPQPEPGTGPNTRQPGTALPGTNWRGTPLSSTATGSGTFTYTGPITASTIRKIACDADIIPVLLGSEGRILDIGRTTRIFPPHIRKALTARDQGCAFPNCTIPAPWCEAHHITYWSRGGPTSTDNGALLCTHHHHLIHKEQWKIHIKNGTPWFIPPPHIDPRQHPRQNHHHKT
ncbi:HNH endonuclease signature motif containing protein, partial [Arthrobacter sp. ISL-65]|uniref:HNH endonuclease signature motif containing protein n=1 Tax=Arthrobacter sp. ISL-65 TaxID=2819112 RepID=UPI00203589DE